MSSPKTTEHSRHAANAYLLQANEFERLAGRANIRWVEGHIPLFRCTPYHEGACEYPSENMYFGNCASFRALSIDIAVNPPSIERGRKSRARSFNGNNFRGARSRGPPIDEGYYDQPAYQDRRADQTLFDDDLFDVDNHEFNNHHFEEAVYDHDFSIEYDDSNDYSDAAYFDEECAKRTIPRFQVEAFNTTRATGHRRVRATARNGATAATAGRRGCAATVAPLGRTSNSGREAIVGAQGLDQRGGRATTTGGSRKLWTR